jgi:tRNA(Ile2)-agmatinylcytidine synthase
MRIGIDDTDSPGGMCTTYIGAVLCQRLAEQGFVVREALLVRLNPNVQFKTRGNAAVCIEAEGDRKKAFEIACACIEEYADFPHVQTHPGLVVTNTYPDSSFYYKAVRDFCEIEEALSVCKDIGALYKGWKNQRGLIGATAAVASVYPDYTYELLAYRNPEQKEERKIGRMSVFRSEAETTPHTWDSVDCENGLVVCVPHTPDPVLFGIRGESPSWIRKARSYINSEEPEREQIYRTNQGTDVHLLRGKAGSLKEGRSYILRGSVVSVPVTRPGGHVAVEIEDEGERIRCMAYEPTKGFRDIVRSLVPGDRIRMAGSYKQGSINLEKVQVLSCAESREIKPPLCERCRKRMTSAGRGKGYKCRICGSRKREPEILLHPRSIVPGWYEVPPCARRHLAKPLIRGPPPADTWDFPE